MILFNKKTALTSPIANLTAGRQWGENHNHHLAVVTVGLQFNSWLANWYRPYF
jgi:hypothetical protein